MITTRDKCLAAMTEASRHRIKARVCDEDFMRQGHEDAAAIFDAIAEDYTKTRAEAEAAILKEGKE